jgi:cyclase
VGDINWLNKNYNLPYISRYLDELMILDVERTEDRSSGVREAFLESLRTLTQKVFLPICAGGKIQSVEDASLLFKNGAEKVVLNSGLYDNPDVVKEIVNRFGAQAVIASVDYRVTENGIDIYGNNGQKKEECSVEEVFEKLKELNCGEIMFNSIDKDGTGFGPNFDFLDLKPRSFDLPVIISGGFGKPHHLEEALSRDDVEAISTSNILNFIGDSFKNAREILFDKDIPLGKW